MGEKLLEADNLMKKANKVKPAQPFRHCDVGLSCRMIQCCLEPPSACCDLLLLLERWCFGKLTFNVCYDLQYWSPSLLDFRLKPDWESAAPLFEKAALAYKVSFLLSLSGLHSSLHNTCVRPNLAVGCPHSWCSQQAGQLEKARGAYEQAAQSQEKIGSPWHAAKHLETCSTISKDLGQLERVADFSRQAGSLYAQAGRMAAGAQHTHSAHCCKHGHGMMPPQAMECAMPTLDACLHSTMT
jgi:hypothetical protein